MLVVRSRHARGTVEARSRFGRGAQGLVAVRSWCGRGMLAAWLRHAQGLVVVLKVRSWCGRGTLVVRSRHARGMVEARSRFGRGVVTVRSWCGRGMLAARLRHARCTVEARSKFGRRFQYAHRCGSGSVRYFNILSGGTVRILHLNDTVFFLYVDFPNIPFILHKIIFFMMCVYMAIFSLIYAKYIPLWRVCFFVFIRRYSSGIFYPRRACTRGLW